MGKIVEGKKKKKGRPSLLDLQKRNLKEQQHHQKLTRNAAVSGSPLPHSSTNYKSATPTPLRRSTRRNPSADEKDDEEEDEEEDATAAELNGKRREKKLKLVLKLPKSDANSAENRSDSDREEVDNTASNSKKRKINAIGDGSDSEKREKSVSGTNPTSSVQDLGPSTTLPDKKLLVFILDRLQKKDTYGAFSEPVDPNELPDYREVIDHPMDFQTIREKLSSGVYANLEQFEKDVFLICSNAMQYNAPDTIYFRQARSIQELAKKDFGNLRQDSDDNEPGPKIARRGRPPTKNFKRPQGRPPLDCAGSEFSANATLANAVERNNVFNNDLRKGSHHLDKPGFADSSGRLPNSQNDTYLSSENRFQRSDEATGSILRGNAPKHGKKQFLVDENRRNTYNQFHPSTSGREPSVLATFDAQGKHLVAVGLLTEHGYARSLARFAATMGPVAWKIASNRIEMALPPGVKFGPGWVVENDIPSQRSFLLSSPFPGQPSSLQALSLPDNSSVAVTPCAVESREKLSNKAKENNLPEKQVPSIHSDLEKNSSSHLPSSAVKSEPGPDFEGAEVVKRLNSSTEFNTPNNCADVIRPRAPFQFHQNPVIRSGMNGLNGAHWFNLPGMSKVVAAARAAGFDFHPSQMANTISRTNTDLVQPANEKDINAENPKLPENSSAINSGDALPNSGNEELESTTPELQTQPSLQEWSEQPKLESGLSPHEKPDSVPPDLNIEFQSSSSPNTQPDLALQL